jgi:hypothetical protein
MSVPRKRNRMTISRLEYDMLQAESALLWEMTNDYGEQREDGTWEHPFRDVIMNLHPKSAQRVIDADLDMQESGRATPHAATPSGR